MNAGERKQSMLRLGFTMLGSFAMATSVSAQSVLEEVVVTATKRETSLDRTPVAITAMSGEQLDRQGIRDAVDLAAFVPGLEIANTTGNLQIGLRGVSNDSFALARDAAIAYHVDGVFRGRQSGGNGAFLDVERVEVVKGPQGTLYGRNATAGSINVVTANPTQNFEGYAEAVAGNYNRMGGRAVVNVPVIEDKFAIRAAVLRDTRDGFFDNGPLIRNDYSDSDDTAARLKALITPTQNLSVLLTAEYQGRGGVGDGTQTLSGQGAVLKDLRNPYRIYLNTEGQRDDDLYTYSAEVNYELPGATLTYLGAYFDSSVYLLMDFDRTDVLPFPLSINVDSEQWSHELRLSSSTGGRFEWLVGAYLFDENVARINDVTVNASLRTLSLQPDFNVNSRAAFGQASWQLTDEVKLTAGARYTKDEKDERNTQSIRIFNGVRTEVSASLASEWSSTDWTVGMDWTPTDATMLYAKVGTGFKSGGFNDPLQANLGANRIFAPEEILAYQIGHKTRLLGGTVRLSSEAYYYDYTDLQVSQSVQGGSAFTSNAADAEIYGVEVEMTAQPTDRLTLGLGLNYLEATFGDFVTYDSIERQMADLTGKRLARSPRWTFNAAARYVFDLPNDWTVVPGITFGYRDKSKLRFFEDRGSMQPEWTRTDVTLDFNSPTGAVLFQLFANNLEDDVVWTTAAVNPAGDRTLNVRPPTMYGARVRYNFGQ